MNHLKQFITSPQFIEFSTKNPKSKKEIISFLTKFYSDYSTLSGIKETYKKLAESTMGTDKFSMKWFNFLSQIRCINFLLEQKYNVQALEAAKGNKQLDFLLADGRFGDVKSFSATTTKKEAWSWDEYVLKEFRDKKLIPAFTKQGADVVIIDDVFSDYGDQYGLLIYFLSFINDNEAEERKKLVKSLLGPYLPKLLILSFVKSLTRNPLVRFKGKEFDIS